MPMEKDGFSQGVGAFGHGNKAWWTLCLDPDSSHLRSLISQLRLISCPSKRIGEVAASKEQDLKAGPLGPLRSGQTGVRNICNG